MHTMVINLISPPPHHPTTPTRPATAPPPPPPHHHHHPCHPQQHVTCVVHRHANVLKVLHVPRQPISEGFSGNVGTPRLMPRTKDAVNVSILEDALNRWGDLPEEVRTNVGEVLFCFPRLHSFAGLDTLLAPATRRGRTGGIAGGADQVNAQGSA